MAKLHMDFVCEERLRAAMDEDNLELTARLCTRIGIIMEDASVIALTIGAASEGDRTGALAQLSAAAGHQRSRPCCAGGSDLRSGRLEVPEWQLLNTRISKGDAIGL